VSAPDFLIVGRVRNAHGIRGEVVVEELTDDPDQHFAVGRRLFAGTPGGDLIDENAPGPREVTVRRAVPFKGGRILRFKEITDRDLAESWRDRYLLVPRAQATPPAEGEVYLHDLVGLRVESTEGVDLGKVQELFDMPHGVLLDVRTSKGTVMIPYRPELISRVDLERRVIIVDASGGLFDV
jgi:16S rRNA processing protein RimM